jgi:hypothetical protein
VYKPQKLGLLARQHRRFLFFFQPRQLSTLASRNKS